MNAVTEQQIHNLTPVERQVEAAMQWCVAQHGRNIQAPETWPSTREIAENCNFSIYKTRYLLLKMVAKGRMQVTPHPVKNALRWYLCPEHQAHSVLGKEDALTENTRTAVIPDDTLNIP
ncbi:FaeA/PapI family transcriptional regulator [Serratia marcescens]|uniref:FaeA/PapI family transcriptional regulator n=1 Tax=Serratia marcescens TaxID=615 RepID=UPI002FE63C8E